MMVKAWGILDTAGCMMMKAWEKGLGKPGYCWLYDGEGLGKPGYCWLYDVEGLGNPGSSLFHGVGQDNSGYWRFEGIAWRILDPGDMMDDLVGRGRGGEGGGGYM